MKMLASRRVFSLSLVSPVNKMRIDGTGNFHDDDMSPCSKNDAAKFQADYNMAPSRARSVATSFAFIPTVSGRYHRPGSYRRLPYIQEVLGCFTYQDLSDGVSTLQKSPIPFIVRPWRILNISGAPVFPQTECLCRAFAPLWQNDIIYFTRMRANIGDGMI